MPTSTAPCQDLVSSSAPGCSVNRGRPEPIQPLPGVARTTPASRLTIASGKKRAVLVPRAQRLASTMRLTNGPSARSTSSPGSGAFYDARRAAGDLHHQALRALGNRLVGILTAASDTAPTTTNTKPGHTAKPTVTQAALNTTNWDVSKNIGATATLAAAAASVFAGVGLLGAGTADAACASFFGLGNVTAARAPSAASGRLGYQCHRYLSWSWCHRHCTGRRLHVGQRRGLHHGHRGGQEQHHHRYRSRQHRINVGNYNYAERDQHVPAGRDPSNPQQPNINVGSTT